MIQIEVLHRAAFFQTPFYILTDCFTLLAQVDQSISDTRYDNSHLYIIESYYSGRKIQLTRGFGLYIPRESVKISDDNL